jgi:hypothetical protein
MGLELLSMTVFWTWNAFHPALQPAPVAMVVPTKVILQASWVEPVSLRDETSPPAHAHTAAKKRQWPTSKRAPLATVRKPQKPLWQAAKSWEIPPILWAGFEGFLAAGLGIVSLLKR